MEHQRSLIVLSGEFAVCRLSSDTPIPAWTARGDFFSITRTADELSIVCLQDAVPEGVHSERDWRCLRVAGAMPFSVVGVLARLTTALADAGVSVFAVSTFDTDYLLVKSSDWLGALDALHSRGYSISDS